MDPIWNQQFSFKIDNDVTEVLIKLFDKDDLSADDPLGTAVWVAFWWPGIYMGDVLSEIRIVWGFYWFVNDHMSDHNVLFNDRARDHNDLFLWSS